MAEFPALPLWTDAYLADTHPDLSLEEHGCYLLLLMAAWRRPGCSLPDDDAWICRWLGIHGNRWRPLRKAVLERFFTLTEQGSWQQKRQRKERDFVEKRSRKAKESIAKRWAKAKENKGLGDTDVHTPTPTPTPTVREDSSLRSESGRAPRATRLPAEYPMTDQHRAIAREEGFTDAEAERVHAAFADYWHAAAGANARKCDWLAAWRGWVRREADRRPRQPAGGQVNGRAGGHGAAGQVGRPAVALAVAHARNLRANRDLG